MQILLLQKAKKKKKNCLRDLMFQRLKTVNLSVLTGLTMEYLQVFRWGTGKANSQNTWFLISVLHQ